MQAVFQATETNGLNAKTENDLVQQLQADRDKRKDDINAVEIDMSEGMAAEMFGISSPVEEVTKHPFIRLTKTCIQVHGNSCVFLNSINCFTKRY